MEFGKAEPDRKRAGLGLVRSWNPVAEVQRGRWIGLTD